MSKEFTFDFDFGDSNREQLLQEARQQDDESELFHSVLLDNVIHQHCKSSSGPANL